MVPNVLPSPLCDEMAETCPKGLRLKFCLRQVTCALDVGIPKTVPNSPTSPFEGLHCIVEHNIRSVVVTGAERTLHLSSCSQCRRIQESTQSKRGFCVQDVEPTLLLDGRHAVWSRPN